MLSWINWSKKLFILSMIVFGFSLNSCVTSSNHGKEYEWVHLIRCSVENAPKIDNVICLSVGGTRGLGIMSCILGCFGKGPTGPVFGMGASISICVKPSIINTMREIAKVINNPLMLKASEKGFSPSTCEERFYATFQLPAKDSRWPKENTKLVDDLRIVIREDKGDLARYSRMFLASYFAVRKKYTEALNEYREVLNDPDTPDYIKIACHWFIAEIYYRLQAYADCRKECKIIVKQFSQFNESDNYLNAQTLLKYGIPFPKQLKDEVPMRWFWIYE